MKSIYLVRELLFPFGCGYCGEALLSGDESYFGICEKCRSFLNSRIMQSQSCAICGRELISEKAICLLCRKESVDSSDEFNKWILKAKLLFPYTGNYKKMLGAYKFNKSIGIANFFVDCLILSMNALLTGESDASWVPVPPRPGRIKAQGWDQIGHIAGLLEKRPGNSIQVCRCLRRLPSRSQKELNREERKINIKGKILCHKAPPKTAVIFDDVFTTGATLNACARALKEAGTEKVFGICLYYD